MKNLSTYQFYDMLIAEIAENAMGLNSEQYEQLWHYYRGVKEKPRLRKFYRYNWVRRVVPMVDLLTSLPQRDSPWRLLDAGCGIGTEAIFLSTLRSDLEITGIDVSDNRLSVAEVRRVNYEQHLNSSLKVSFLNQDVFELLEKEYFDMVWTMEAISHIDPAENFIAKVFEKLHSGGYLVISDSNSLNPVMAWRVCKLRKKGTPLRSSVTTSEGKVISYANERLFSVGELRKTLKSVGFQRMQTQLSVFFPPIMAHYPNLFKICVKCDRILNKVPLLRNIGGIYTISTNK